jgi:hypothetical protein
VDTCCIDKTSSAELSEAINSMFSWYRDAAICYVYLSDVGGGDDVSQKSRDISTSLWFSRGWTLQELIAPSVVVFFARDWSEIGSRSVLIEQITAATGIDRGLFNNDLLSPTGTSNRNRLNQYSIAQKMAWASKRKTTRVEDEAYCLLGLFGVNMPLIYGEGKTAFIRLQEEIMKRSSDHSIFAWDRVDRTLNGFLADSPAYFSGCEEIVQGPDAYDLSPFNVTNKGIQITLQVVDAAIGDDLNEEEIQHGKVGISILMPNSLIAVFNCSHSKGPKTSRLGLVLDTAGRQLFDARNRTCLRSGSPVSIPQKVVRDKATKTPMFLQATHEGSYSGLELDHETHQNYEDGLLLLIRLPRPEELYGFRLTQTYPPSLNVATYESGLISCRLSANIEEDTAILLFDKENSGTFCLFAEALNVPRRILTNLVTNIPAEENIFDQVNWVLRSSNRTNRVKSGIQYAGAAVLSIHAVEEQRHFGSCIRLNISPQTHE